MQGTHSSHKLNFVQYAEISFLTSLKNKRWALNKVTVVTVTRYTDKQLSPHDSYYVIPTTHSGFVKVL